MLTLWNVFFLLILPWFLLHSITSLFIQSNLQLFLVVVAAAVVIFSSFSSFKRHFSVYYLSLFHARLVLTLDLLFSFCVCVFFFVSFSVHSFVSFSTLRDLPHIHWTSTCLVALWSCADNPFNLLRSFMRRIGTVTNEQHRKQKKKKHNNVVVERLNALYVCVPSTNERKTQKKNNEWNEVEYEWTT